MVAVVALVVVLVQRGGDARPGVAQPGPGQTGPGSQATPDPDGSSTPPPGGGGGLGGGGSDPLAVDPNAPNPLPDPSPEQVANLEQLFEVVDDAELVMLDFLVAMPRSEDGSLTESELDAARSVGSDAADALRDLRAQMEQFDSTGPPDEPIRDAYLAHLQVWIDYTQAVADDPTLLLGGGGDHTQAISDTAWAFTDSIPAQLGDLSTLPSDLADLIREIVERGFSGAGGESTPEI